MKNFFLLGISMLFLAHINVGAQETYTTKEATKE